LKIAGADGSVSLAKASWQSGVVVRDLNMSPLLIWQRVANWVGGVVVFVRNLGVSLDLRTWAYIVCAGTRLSRDGCHT
jgi:hypothetical protein